MNPDPKITIYDNNFRKYGGKGLFPARISDQEKINFITGIENKAKELGTTPDKIIVFLRHDIPDASIAEMEEKYNGVTNM